MPEIGRRKFLGLLGLSATGAALGGCDAPWWIPQPTLEDALRGPGIESFKNSVCQLCPAGCGIRVRLIDGIPVHIDGNPLHPINRGGICPHGAAGLDFLYHPDRIQQPLARVGPRGGSQWKPISWDKALDRVAGRLRSLRARRAPQQVGFFVHEKRGLMFEIISRFMESLGSRNVIVLDEHQHDALPFELLFGWSGVPQYDLEHAKFVLSFGANFLEDGASPVHGIQAYSKMRAGDSGERGRLAFIDSRHSLTAASADEFLAIKPGTHGAVALGIAYVLIKERYYDPLFVKQYVDHFESWTDEQGASHLGFKEHVLSSYYPERVAQISGLPARRIVELAREFGRSGRSLAMIGQLGEAGANGLLNSLAVLSLNVLVGAVEKKGGLRMQRSVPYEHLPPLELDEVARRGLGKPALCEDGSHRFPLEADPVFAFCENVLSGDLYPLDTLFIYGTNPAFDHPYARRIRQALDKIPMIVSFAGILDESSEYADLVLPDHAYLERWTDSGSTPGIAIAHASVGHPVLDPLYDTRHSGDVLIDLAGRVGGSVAEAFPSGGFLAVLKTRYHGVFTSGEGAVISGSFEESWLQFLKQRGWQNLVYESFEDFWEVLVERGGWWDPVQEEIPPEHAIRTDSGKIPFYLQRLAVKLESLVGSVEAPGSARDILRRWGINQENGATFLPHYEKACFDEPESHYPYCLLIFNLLSNRRGSGSVSPLLQEMFGYYQRVYWNSWVELNPETAHRHHLRQGDQVRVTSKNGSISAPVVINEALEPHSVAIPFGLGHTSCGRYAKGVGVNPYEITNQTTDNLFGRPATMATRVKIEKHKGR